MMNEPESRDPFNPFLVWTDLGMRAAEAAVASTQNMAEGADRLTRAAASADGTDADDEASSTADHGNRWATAGLSGMANIQRLMWDLTTRNWMQWMSMAGNLMSAGAGVGLAPTVAHQENPLKTVRSNMEHALAAPELKTRGKAAAKRGKSLRR
jgi:hypothetical protein